MDPKRLKKLAGRSLVLAAALLGATALVMLAVTAQDSERFGRTHDLVDVEVVALLRAVHTRERAELA